MCGEETLLKGREIEGGIRFRLLLLLLLKIINLLQFMSYFSVFWDQAGVKTVD